MKIMEVSPNIYRILETSNVYSDDKAKLGEYTFEVDGVSFILGNELHRFRGSVYSSPDYEKVTKPLAEQQLLFYVIPHQAVSAAASAIADHLHGRAQYSLVVSPSRYDETIEIKVLRQGFHAPIGDPFIDRTPMSECVYSLELKHEQGKSFSTAAERDEYITDFANKAVARLAEAIGDTK